MSVFKIIVQRISLVFVASFMAIFPALAGDMYKADSAFLEGRYAEAEQEYLSAANVGSAHAFYQLGLMHYKGLGVEQNAVKALVWFNLAAEQKFNDSETIVADLLALANEQQKQELSQLIESFRQEYGLQFIQQAYFPLVKSEALAQRIVFGDKDKPESQFAELDFNDLHDIDFDIERTTILESEGAAIGNLLLGRPGATAFQDRPYSAVVDYDIAKDGSVRNMNIMQKLGYTKPAIRELKFASMPKPHAGDRNVTFMNRAYIGVAGYNKHRIRNKRYEDFYYRTLRRVLKMKESESKEDQFQYAVALMTFSWLEQEEGELEQVLHKLALAGHPLAQYEYGFKLYREQKEIDKAIHWLSEASKYGVSKAQYRLAQILSDSPWVENDEVKAQFWFERAASSGHEAATLRSAELRLLATDSNLREHEAAKTWLASLPESQHKNPEFEYLQAIAEIQAKPRKLPKAVAHLREAISMSDDLAWDVSEWQGLLDKWTSGGSVTVQDLL